MTQRRIERYLETVGHLPKEDNGGALLVYFTPESDILCGDCANRSREEVNHVMPYMEGPTINCACCLHDIESKHGE